MCFEFRMKLGVVREFITYIGIISEFILGYRYVVGNRIMVISVGRIGV